MMSSESLTVVFVAYNSGDVLQAAMDAVRENLPGAEIVVVDNGSSDGSGDIARVAGAHVVEGQGNVGFGAGVNRGVEAAQGTHVLVLNPDATIEVADVPALGQLMGRRPFGIVALVEREGDSERPLTRPVYPWLAELSWMYYAWFLAPGGFRVPRPSCARLGTRFSGAAFIVERDEFLGIGGFNERLFLYHEDEELSLRYERMQRPVEASRVIVVAHEQGTSSPRNHERVLAWQLMSFVELQALAGFEGRVRRSAWAVVRGLQLIRALGRAFAPIPKIGARAAQKSASAGRVLHHLAVESQAPPRGLTYPVASGAIRGLLANDD